MHLHTHMSTCTPVHTEPNNKNIQSSRQSNVNNISN